MILSLILPLVALVCCESNVWNGIVPLKSTRVEVEKVLRKRMPHSIAKYAAGYRTETERVFITYSTGPCNVKPNNGWNVPELTVIDIMVLPDTKQRLADLKWDISKAERKSFAETPGLVNYTNTVDGIAITAYESDGLIDYFRYFPKSKDFSLKCTDDK
jgi:hypothetical protein